MLGPALYYPYIHFKSRSWLRTALLYHDELTRIIPSGIEPDNLADYQQFALDAHALLREVTLLKQVGFIRDEHPTPEVIETVANRFFDFAHANLFDEGKRRRLIPVLSRRARNFQIHPAKIDRSLLDILRELKLAREIQHDPYGDWELEPVTASLYLLFLASAMAGTRPLVTDNAIFQALLYAPVSRQQEGARPDTGFRLAAAVFESIAATNSRVPLETMLRFREDCAEERRRFKAKIDELGGQLAATQPDQIPAAIESHVRGIQDEVAALEDRFRAAGISCVRNLFAMSVPSYVTAEWGMHTAHPFVVSAAAAIAVSATLLGYAADRKQAQRSPWAYLLGVRETFPAAWLASDIAALRLTDTDPDEDWRTKAII